MALWWSMLTKMNKEFQKEKKLTESEMVMKVMQRADRARLQLLWGAAGKGFQQSLHRDRPARFLCALYHVVGIRDLLSLRRHRADHEEGKSEKGSLRGEQ